MLERERTEAVAEVLGKIIGHVCVILILISLVAMCGYVLPPMVGVVLYGWDWWSAALFTITFRLLFRRPQSVTTLKVN